MLKSLSMCLRSVKGGSLCANGRVRAIGGTKLQPKFPVETADNHGVLLPFLRRNDTHRKVRQLIEGGVGIRESQWPMTEPGDARARAELAEDVASWVRGAMGEMRRPYGIDHVALALACRDKDGSVVTSTSLGVIRPGSFYGADGITRISGFLEDVERLRRDAPMHIAGALLSLGDLAFELGVAKAA